MRKIIIALALLFSSVAFSVTDIFGDYSLKRADIPQTNERLYVLFTPELNKPSYSFSFIVSSKDCEGIRAAIPMHHVLPEPSPNNIMTTPFPGHVSVDGGKQFQMEWIIKYYKGRTSAIVEIIFIEQINEFMGAASQGEKLQAFLDFTPMGGKHTLEFSLDGLYAATHAVREECRGEAWERREEGHKEYTPERPTFSI